MKTQIHLLLAASLLTVVTTPLRAQIVADGATNTLSNVTVTTGDLTVGTNGAFTLLLLSDNATLNTSRDGTIGANLTAKSNEVRLLSPTAYWSVGTNLFIGSNGALNRLTISNGAQVESRGGYIGGFHFLSSNNEVVVTGPGSLWTNLGLSIGVISPGNRLMISNGGRVSSGGGLLGVANPLDARNNTALVTGAGSTWNNQAGLDIGYSGSNCRMVISNAAFVDNALGRIGHGSSGQSASNCEAVVTGSGSVWSNRTGLLVGEFGHAARLVVTNGGAVIALGDVLLGRPFSSTNNRIVVVGSALMATNVAGTAALNLVCGTNQFDSGVIEADLLQMTNSLGFFEFKGGTLVTRGAVISNGVPFVVGNSGATPAMWDVRASPSNHVLSVDLQVGNNSSFNQLLVTNGALLTGIIDAAIGVNSLAKSNSVIIAGVGSRWTVTDEVFVGSNGPLNNLVISNGGSVVDAFGYLGRQLGSSNNLVVATGTGSSWSNQFDLNVGLNGRGNQLLVSEGAAVQSEFGVVGFNASSSNNIALLTGSGSVWSNSADLLVGRSGQRNQMVVSDGAVVQNRHGFVGGNTAGSDNLALVTGSGAAWNNAWELYVGSFGSGNQLVVSNGAMVTAGSGFIGRNANANLNSAVLTDAGTSWLVATNLYVGSNGAFNLLVVSNGAVANCQIGYVGFNATSGTNQAVVTGAGTVWSNQGALNVGESGGGNRLLVNNGGRVESSGGVLGNNTGSSNNEAIVTGPESSWDVSLTSLVVGSFGSANQLVVSNGAAVQGFFGYVGFVGGNNKVVVTDSGSLWTNTFELDVGFNGAGNQLVVTNGGVVRDANGFMGVFTSSSSNNLALVTGPGSLWSHFSELRVGDAGPGNQLVVSNDSVVFAGETIIVGRTASSTNNRVVVDGGTLRVTNIGAGVFEVRRGTNVLNAGMIDVDQLRLTNSAGFFQLNGGTLSAKHSQVGNGTLFRVGNGVSPATFNLVLINGLHTFGNGLSVSSNATIMGNGTISGSLTVASGGKLIPGAGGSAPALGKLVLSDSPSLQGTVIMEISKDGTTLTNDQVEANAALTYGGSLIVTNIGPDALAAGDNFKLFTAGTFAGSFASLTLPPLNPGLGWTNKLLVDGSFEVVAVAVPKFASISLSGTNMIISGTNGPPNAPYAVLTATNVTTPSSNWVSLVTNQFGSGGQFSFTNPIAPGELQRYFRIRTP